MSLYLLEVYPNAPLKDEMARAGWSLAPDDDAAEMYLWSMERLEAAGYEQYEISNVARPGRASRHNLKYWRTASGSASAAARTRPAAASGGRMSPSTEEYIDANRRPASRSPPNAASSTDDERLGDALFTGLRLTDGRRHRRPSARATAWTSGRGSAVRFSPSSTPACCCARGRGCG